MLTELQELYKLYKIYKKIIQVKDPACIVNEHYCQDIKQMVLAGGCIYIKFAQWIISRLRSESGPGIEYIVNYFDDIFDNCPFHSLKDTITTLNKTTFDILDFVVPNSLQRLASGSVGQVYRARLIKPYIVCPKCDTILVFSNPYSEDPVYDVDTYCNCKECDKTPGRHIYDIAIKVKHPDVDKQVRDKIKLFQLLTKFQQIKWIKDWLCIHIDMEDFICNLTKQIDFTNEFDNNREFRDNFRDNNLIQFPLTLEAGHDYLVSEFIETCDLDTLPEYLQLKTCMNYACMVSQMVLIDNFVHADLHHKNWSVKQYVPGDTNAQIVIFDTGICFESSDTNLTKTIWESFESTDIDQIMDILDKMVTGPFTTDVKEHIKTILEHYRTSNLDITHIMTELNDMLAKYGCRLTNLSLNIILLLCLIDTTLKKHNLIGNAKINATMDPRISPAKSHHNFLRTKNLDIIAYIKSKPGCYLGLLDYFVDKQDRLARSYSAGNISLFGNNLASGLVLDLPADD